MDVLLGFLARIDVFIYALLAVGVYFAIRGIMVARRMRRMTIYALEREEARQRAQAATRNLVALLVLALIVYILANIAAPNVMVVEEVTPTPEVFLTPEPTPTEFLLLYPSITPTLALAAGTPPADTDVNGCEIIGTTITSPTAGQQVSGQVTVEGEANIIAFLQYRFELRGAGTQNEWVVVNTFTSPRPQGFLGTWDSTSLSEGDYELRLVVFRTDGVYLPPCTVPVSIARSGGGSPGEG